MTFPLEVFVALALSAAPAEPQVVLEVTCASDAVKAAITVHRGELQACYERRLAKAPDLTSTSVLEWTVRADGTITAPTPSAMAAEYEDPELRDCVVARIRSWAFPPPDEPVNVTLVAGFSRKGAARAAAAGKDAPGTMDRTAVQKTVQGHAAEIGKCYQQRLEQDPKLAGKVVMRWQVQADGSVANVTVGDGTTLEDHALHECMRARIAGWRFPRPENGGVATVTYPWVLRAQVGK
jgi:hypothetical protein